MCILLCVGEAGFFMKQHTDKVHWLAVEAASATDTDTQRGDAPYSDCHYIHLQTNTPVTPYMFFNSSRIVQI